jgi:hypothetical protein
MVSIPIGLNNDSYAVLGGLFDAIHGRLRPGHFAAVDDAPAAADVSIMATDAMIAALGYSWSCHQSLPSYGGLYQRVESELIRRGVDAEPELRGLAPTAVAEEMSDAQ